MDQLVIRKADKFDIKSINKLNFEMHQYLTKRNGIKLSKKELKEEETNEKELKRENYFVATIKDEVVGFIAFSKKIFEDEWYKKHVYLHEIAVAKNIRGKGVGKRLFQTLLDYADKKKLNIKVDTHITNVKTIKFYKKLGFEPFSIDFILKKEDLNN